MLPEPLQYLHDVQDFIRRDIEASSEEELAVFDSCELGYSVQCAAELIMSSADFARVFNSPYRHEAS